MNENTQKDGYSALTREFGRNAEVFDSGGIYSRIVRMVPRAAIGGEWICPASTDVVAAVQDACSVIELEKTLIDYQIFGKSVLMIKDDRGLDQAPTTCKSVERIKPGTLQVVKQFKATKAPSLYSIDGRYVHPQRLIIQETKYPPMRGLDSKCKEYNRAMSFLPKLLERLQQPVYSMQGLKAAMQTGQQSAVNQMIVAVDQFRSAMNTVLIDSGDSYSILSPNVSGAEKLVEAIQGDLSAITGIPVSKLFGTSSSGLNSGAADNQRWADEVKHFQTRHLEPIYRRIAGFFTKEDVSITFLSVIPETAEERSNRFKTDADNVVALVNAGIISTEEARQIMVNGGFVPPVPDYDTEDIDNDTTLD